MAHNAVVERLKARGVVLPKHGPALSASFLAKKGIHDLAEFDRQVATLYAEGTPVTAVKGM
jgi:hypothetical protein